MFQNQTQFKTNVKAHKMVSSLKSHKKRCNRCAWFFIIPTNITYHCSRETDLVFFSILTPKSGWRVVNYKQNLHLMLKLTTWKRSIRYWDSCSVRSAGMTLLGSVFCLTAWPFIASEVIHFSQRVGVPHIGLFPVASTRPLRAKLLTLTTHSSVLRLMRWCVVQPALWCCTNITVTSFSRKSLSEGCTCLT